MKRILYLISLLALHSTFCVSQAWGDVKMNSLFQSGMVLQRNQPIPVWGTADSGETVTITFRGKNYTTTADQQGNWRIDLPKQKAGGPYTLTATTSTSASASTSASTITLDDILIGDVWIVSGQSNIDTNLERVYPQYTTDIDTYQNDNIRVFHVPVRTATTPQTNVKGETWHRVNKETCWKFSALGYFLAQRMYNDTKGVPQGVIQTSQGGTPIQSWVTIDSIKGFGDYYERFMLYTDPEYVQLMSRANSRGGDVWTNTMNSLDPGFGKFEKADCDDSQWKKVNQYDTQSWAKGLGSVWLRQHVYVDAAHAGKECTLNMGTLHDMDNTYVNGKLVGTTYYQYPPRRYKVPAGLLHEGDNVITVRITCKSGRPFFYKDKPHEFTFGDKSVNDPSRDRIEIALDWLTHPGGTMKHAPLGGPVDTNNQASVLYNAMVAPLAPYAISGVVWYQGESNTGKAWEYAPLLRKLTANWRAIWQRPDLPFNIVQLANHMEPSANPQDTGWSQVREAQRTVANESDYNSLTVAIDLGEAADIHPLRKREVAERCALALSNAVYGKKNLLSPQPLSAALSADGTQVIVTMDQPLQGVDDAQEVELKGDDGKFHTAKATVSGTQIIITGKGTAVRYAWKNNPDRANIYGNNNLPASPFEIAVK